jgi:hypothetical protein
VHEEISRRTGSIFLVSAPLEKPHGIERALRGMHHEAVPIYGRRRGIRRNRGFEGSQFVVSIPPGLDHVRFTDGAGSNQLPGLPIYDRTHALAAHLHYPAGSLLRVDHRLAFLKRMDHRLPAVNILAGVHRVDGYAGMPVVRRSHDHRVNIRASQNFPPGIERAEFVSAEPMPPAPMVAIRIRSFGETRVWPPED